MEAININIPNRSRKGRFNECKVNQPYHFKLGQDFELGKENTLRSAAAAYAKNKKLKAVTELYRNDTVIKDKDNNDVEIKAGMIITFIQA